MGAFGFMSYVVVLCLDAVHPRFIQEYYEKMLIRTRSYGYMHSYQLCMTCEP